MPELLNLWYTHPILISYLTLINIATFVVYGTDKLAASAQAWRVREKTLLLLALAGGSIGAIIGIKLFRHKTKKSGFLLILGVIFLLQLATTLYLTGYISFY